MRTAVCENVLTLTDLFISKHLNAFIQHKKCSEMFYSCTGNEHPSSPPPPPPSVRKGFIKGETLRLLRSNPSKTLFKQNMRF